MTDIVIIFSCSMLGCLIARLVNRSIRNRELLYMQLYTFTCDFADNVEHEKLTLHGFITVSAKCYRELMLHLLSDGSVIGCRLTNSDMLEIEQFLVGLEATNSEILLLHLSRYGATFDSKYNELHKVNIMQCSVNSKVGILLGAVLALLLI